MATEITKNFSMDVKFSRDDEENLSVTDINYTQMLTAMAKRIKQEAESSMGIVSSHIVGDVTVT